MQIGERLIIRGAPMTGHTLVYREMLGRYLARRELGAVGSGKAGLAGVVRARLELRMLDVKLVLGLAREVAVAAERLSSSFEENDLPELVGESLGLMAEACLMQSRYEDMERASRRAIDLYRCCGDKAGEAGRCNALGVALEDTGRPEQGLACYQQALHLYRELGDITGIGQSLVNVATVTGGLGRPEEAERGFRDAIAALEQGSDRVSLAFAHSNFSVLLARLGRREEARACLERSRQIRERIGDRYGLGFSLSNIARDLLQSGAWKAGELMLADAIALRRSIGDRLFLAGDLLSLGALRRNQLRLEEARMLMQQAAAMGRELSNTGVEAAARLLLAAVCCDQQQWNDAESWLAAAASAEPGSVEWPLARLVRARCSIGRGEYGDAEPLLAALVDGPGARPDLFQAEAQLLRAGAAAAAGAQTENVRREYLRAIDLAKQDESGHQSAVALFRFGEWLKRTGQRWEEAAAQAEAIFSQLGATAWMESVNLARMM